MTVQTSTLLSIQLLESINAGLRRQVPQEAAPPLFDRLRRRLQVLTTCLSLGGLFSSIAVLLAIS